VLRSIQWPFRVESENYYRRVHPMVRAAGTKKQRGEVALVLRQLRRVQHGLLAGTLNSFDVKLVRICAGAGLDFGNLVAMKSAQDEVAAWLGLDDRDPRCRFVYRQQRCRSLAGRPGHYLRIEIRCLEQGGEVIRVLGGAPSELGPEAEQNPPALARRRPPPTLVQPQLPIRTVWVALPWEQGDGGLVVDELPEYAGVDVPPATREVRIPDGWAPPTLRGITARPGATPTLTLHRTEHRDPELGSVWVYRYQPIQQTTTRDHA